LSSAFTAGLLARRKTPQQMKKPSRSKAKEANSGENARKYAAVGYAKHTRHIAGPGKSFNIFNKFHGNFSISFQFDCKVFPIVVFRLDERQNLPPDCATSPVV
jgi:hypothetical protein